MNKNIKIVLIITLVIITVLSLYPVERTGTVETITVFDKILHLVVYVFITVLLGMLRYKNKKYIKLLLLLILYGFVIECLQELSPGRTFSFLDMIANIIGLFLGYLFIQTYKRFLWV